MKRLLYGFIAFIFALPVLAAWAEEELRLATTTSLENSGLLGHLLPAFEQQCGCRVRVIPVGTGKALALGRHGDVDALLVHAPAAEQAFIAAGYGVDRRPLAYNYFILLAPPGDDAAVAASGDIFTALQKIAAQRAPFLSRGDDSGTHKKELALWRQMRQRGLQIARENDWYIEAGTGMGQAIIMADELGAYILADSGTYLHLRDKVRLRPVTLPPSDFLYNLYSVMRVNEARHPHVNGALAKRFMDWLGTAAVRRRIADYRLFGEVLFAPVKE